MVQRKGKEEMDEKNNNNNSKASFPNINTSFFLSLLLERRKEEGTMRRVPFSSIHISCVFFPSGPLFILI
jgi:hypothetical protein